jgi:hypothetical protein
VLCVASVIEPELKTRGLRRAEYDRLVDLGMFEGERLFLAQGIRGALTGGSSDGRHGP